MERLFTTYLQEWKNRTDRKPLIVRGARQVGKTTIEEFGQESFTDIIKINFEEFPELISFFDINDIEEILQNVEIYFGKRIIPSKTLLFLDEIQACPKAILRLRYFYEKNQHFISSQQVHC